MARKYRGGEPSGCTVLVVDDSPDILESTRLLLEAEGHRVLTATQGRGALEVLATEPVQLILLDYFMPGMTGEEVVRRVRERDRLVQIVLVTGYAGEKPARQMMRRLDIQGYHDKSEGAERLLIWVDAALNTYRQAYAIEWQRRALRSILDQTPEMYGTASLDALFETLFRQACSLLGAGDALLATLPLEQIGAGAGDTEGSPLGAEGGGRAASLAIRLAAGRFGAGTLLGALPEPEHALLSSALTSGAVHTAGAASAVPLRVGRRSIGALYLEAAAQRGGHAEVLEVFAHQASAAIRNALLFEAATTDAVTGACLRGFAMQRLRQLLRSARRSGTPTSLLMIDLDHFKRVNDRYGHSAGDRVLANVADLLRGAVRDTDIVCRYGGDEFMVVLPDTPLAGAYKVAERILSDRRATSLEAENGVVSFGLSLGLATLEPAPDGCARALAPERLQAAAARLIAAADRALYDQKRSGAAGVAAPLSWNDVLREADTPAEIRDEER
jgi:diguanylate cyclase (GGDEF)-like protein